MAKNATNIRQSPQVSAPARQEPQDPVLCGKIEARLARLDHLLRRPAIDISTVEAGFRDLASIMPQFVPRNTIEPRTGLPSNKLFEVRTKLDSALRMLGGSRCEEEVGFSHNGFERSQECVQILKSIFKPTASPGWSGKLVAPPRPVRGE